MKPTYQQTLSDAIVNEISSIGVNVVFGITSIHNLPIYDAIHRHGGFRVVSARSEGGAVNMADAYARVSGKIGVVLTSTGTGAGNAAGALVEAATAGTPLLHITGQIDSKYIDSGRGYIHEFEGQLEMLTSLSKQAFRIRKADQAVAILRKALDVALKAPCGPVSVEIPVDFQAKAIDKSCLILTPNDLSPPDPGHIQAISKKLASARRPMLWAGGGVIRSNAANTLLKLVESLGMGVITSQAGRGSIPENHPQCLGHFAVFPEVQELLASADLLLSVGVRFRGNETSNWKIKIPEEHIGIDADTKAINRNFKHSESLIGDAGVILNALLETVLSARVPPKIEFLQEVEAARLATRQRLRRTLGRWGEVLDAINKTLPNDAIIVRDITIPNTSWGNRLIEIRQPRTSIHAAGGGIGQGLPMAVGAQLAAPERTVVLFSGDGGFLVNLGDLATIRDEALPLIAVIYDDGGYGVIRNIQDKYLDGRRVGADLWTPDLVTLGTSFGIRSEQVSHPEALREALNKAVTAREPHLIVVDSNSIGLMEELFCGPDGTGTLIQPHD